MKTVGHSANKIICFSICCLLCAYSGAWAKPAVGAKDATSENTSLINKFYESRGADLFWFRSTQDLRQALISIVDSASFYGFDKRKYHINELKTANNSKITDSAKLRRLDRIYTNAFIAFCKDLYEGDNIGIQLSYDELSGKYKNVSNEHILKAIAEIKNGSDLVNVVKQLEPSDTYYQALKSELRKQVGLNNTSKIKQVKVSLDLYRWIHHFHFEKYIMVNIGSTILKYYEGDEEKLFSRVIVGKPKTKTPRFAAYCNMVIFYPYWNVPRSIAVKEFLPKFKRSAAAVESMNLQVIGMNGAIIDPYSIKWGRYTRNNFPYTLRQSTGCDNSLGVIKFNLTDPFSVYLHDTNAKKLFGSNHRYYSHGCIRIEQAVGLGNYLLPNKIDEAFLASCLKDQKPIETPIAKPVPIFVVYATAEVDSNGQVQYSKDIYGLFK